MWFLLCLLFPYDWPINLQRRHSLLILVQILLCLTQNLPPFSPSSVLASNNLSPKNSDTSDHHTLKFVQVILRHGIRNPLLEYPKDPLKDEKNYPGGFNQLTKKGALMNVKLGEYLRRRYGGKFLHRDYSASEIFVESSNTDRAIMGALSTLAGLYTGPTNDPLIPPVHSVPATLDNFIYFQAKCPRLKEIDHIYVTDGSQFSRRINSANRDLYKYLSKHTGLQINNFRLVSDLYDTLLIQQALGLKLPAWTKNVFPQKMEPLYALPFDPRVEVPTKEAMRVKCGPLLKRLVDNMDRRRRHLQNPESENAEAGEAGAADPWVDPSGDNHEIYVDDTNRDLRRLGRAKMYAISAHDNTISTLLGTLGVFDTQVSDFGSAVFLEMHEMEKSPSQVEVRVTDENLLVDSCGFDDESSPSCARGNRRPLLVEKALKKKHQDFYLRIFLRNETQSPAYEFEVPKCGYPCQLAKFKKLFKDVMTTRSQWRRDCTAKGKIGQ